MLKLKIRTLVLFLCAVFMIGNATPSHALEPLTFEGMATETYLDTLSLDGVSFDAPVWAVGNTPDYYPLSWGGRYITNYVSPNDLTMSFSAANTYLSFEFATYTYDWIEAGDTPFAITVELYRGDQLLTSAEYIGTVPLLDLISQQHAFLGFVEMHSATAFDTVKVHRTERTLISYSLMLDNIVTVAPEPTEDIPNLRVPHLDNLIISASHPVAVYGNPAGEPARLANGQAIMLPHDADHSGFDTYIITGTQKVGNDIWVALFLGGKDYVWLNLSDLP